MQLGFAYDINERPRSAGAYYQSLYQAQTVQPEVEVVREKPPVKSVPVEKKPVREDPPAKPEQVITPEPVSGRASVKSRKLIWVIAAVVVGIGALIVVSAYQDYVRRTRAAALDLQSDPGPVYKPANRQKSTTNPIGDMVFISIPGGSFRMGGEGGRLITIRPFKMSKTEITFTQWEACVADGGCKSNPTPDDEGWGRGARPVINVHWSDVQEYIQWLGEGYRLATESEWEYAARGQSGNEAERVYTTYSWGDQKPVCTQGTSVTNGASFNDGEGSDCYYKKADGSYRGTAEVGQYSVNGFGLYDMHGNVWEWTEDCWHGDVKDTPADGTAWKKTDGGNCGRRVVRGGSWNFTPNWLRSALRNYGPADSRHSNVGFRLVQD